MKKIVRYLSTTIALFLIAGFGLIVHSIALPMSSHAMNGMTHSTGSSLNCATLCAANAFYKDESVLTIGEVEDDEPTIPYYTALHSTFISTFEADSALYSAIVKPPPKVPIYIKNQVFQI